jgi:hypothetical protein
MPHDTETSLLLRFYIQTDTITQNPQTSPFSSPFLGSKNPSFLTTFRPSLPPTWTPSHPITHNHHTPPTQSIQPHTAPHHTTPSRTPAYPPRRPLEPSAILIPRQSLQTHVYTISHPATPRHTTLSSSTPPTVRSHLRNTPHAPLRGVVGKSNNGPRSRSCAHVRVRMRVCITRDGMCGMFCM